MPSTSFWIWAQKQCRGAVCPLCLGWDPCLLGFWRTLLPLTRLCVSTPCGAASEHPKGSVKLQWQNRHSAFSPQVNSRRNLMDLAEGIWREVCHRHGCNLLRVQRPEGSPQSQG